MRIDTVEADSSYDWRRDGWLAACSLTAILLIISAVTPHAPGFDTFLRLFVFCLALVRGFAGFRSGGAWLPLSAAVIAILFNPAKPLAMTAMAWTWCDLIAAAWFAIVGAWRLLRSWDPQRGWAVAAVSLGALAAAAVGAFDMPNRDALTNPQLNVDENAAEMNADSNMAAGTTSAVTAAADAAPAPADTAPSAQSLANTPPSQKANRAARDQREISAETNVTGKPALANGEAASTADEPVDNAPSNSDSGGNQD